MYGCCTAEAADTAIRGCDEIEDIMCSCAGVEETLIKVCPITPCDDACPTVIMDDDGRTGGGSIRSSASDSDSISMSPASVISASAVGSEVAVDWARSRSRRCCCSLSLNELTRVPRSL